MKFLISPHINPSLLDALTDEEKAAIGGGHGRFIESLKESDELITTLALVDPSQSAVVSVRNGQTAVTDGPFLEAKGFLGGFYLIDCDDGEAGDRTGGADPGHRDRGSVRRSAPGEAGGEDALHGGPAGDLRDHTDEGRALTDAARPTHRAVLAAELAGGGHAAQ